VLKPGLTATMSLPQFSDQQFHVQFLTTAQAFNPQTRTVVTELTVENPNNKIWPGTYADVHFVVPGDPNVLVIPEQALLFRAEGLQVAVVRADNTVHLQGVTLGLNLGKTVQIVAGLRPGDRLIDNPSAATMEGQQVRVVPVPTGGKSVSPPGSPGKLSQDGAAAQSPQGGGAGQSPQGGGAGQSPQGGGAGQSPQGGGAEQSPQGGGQEPINTAHTDTASTGIPKADRPRSNRSAP
jgi:hypothetical protein